MDDDLPPPPAGAAAPPDRILVTGLVVDAFIGVLESERHARQRVRFDVEIETVPDYARRVRETGEYVSYADVVQYVESRAATDDHVELVETWAEAVAAVALVNPLAVSARVSVRKLDIFPGAVGVGVTIERRRGAAGAATTCVIALGSNLGDRLANVRHAVARLSSTPGITVDAVSGLYETAPVGGPDDQGAYYNAALRATTTLPAADVLALLHRVEAERERERVVHWGPRTLDLDLLVYGALVSDDPALLVPHPRQHERRFVLVPVCDVAADVVHPVLGRTMGDLLADLPIEPGDLELVATGWHDTPGPTSEPDA